MTFFPKGSVLETRWKGWRREIVWLGRWRPGGVVTYSVGHEGDFVELEFDHQGEGETLVIESLISGFFGRRFSLEEYTPTVPTKEAIQEALDAVGWEAE